ncbi:hypothetical protein J4N42_08535 [Vibrio sp. SCSIO 43135]|uniref:glycosyl hydrolase family 18 protein n=1 Tax=Vibrio sp. SCSIO 43135 TaxID=2819096 RepID=UPI00207501CA|nr:glycosyl hydrolase family 18 protein [Vibrio sp. SCSIO 43135]USD40123.1 hypothetical protein J4N42_08535 [Vibrio sp. SCSIO 43135]
MKKQTCLLAVSTALALTGAYFPAMVHSNELIVIQQAKTQAPQPAPVQTEVIVDSASATWSNMSIKMTNTLAQEVDIDGMVMTFVSPLDVTSVWGNFAGISYPSNIAVSSTQTDDGQFLIQVTTTYADESWINSMLPVGSAISLQFGLGMNATPETISDVKVYLDGVETGDGVITLTAPAAPGSDVANQQATATLSGPNGYQQSVSLDWQTSTTLDSLTYGDYTLDVNPVGAYPADPASQDQTLTEEGNEAQLTWGYGEAIYPASFSVTLPTSDIVESTTLTMTELDTGDQSFYQALYGQQTAVTSLTDATRYQANLEGYRLNNTLHQLLMDGQADYQFVANKDQETSPEVTESTQPVDSTHFLETYVELQGLPDNQSTSVTLVHSEGDMYQHVTSTGDAQRYDLLRPGTYTVSTPVVEVDGKEYMLTTTSAVVSEAGTLTLSFTELSGGHANILAPYKDTNINADWTNGGMESLVDLSQQSGNKLFTLAFILGSEWDPEVCEALWGGQPEMKVSEQWGKKQIDDLRAEGGDVLISFGGANGRYLSQACSSEDLLYAEYKKVIDTYQVYHLDFDVEMGRENDAEAMERMIGALVRLQAEYPQLKVSFTLAAAPDIVRGFNEVVVPAVEAGLEIDSVNPMTMSFGPWYHENYVDDTAELSILTVEYLKTLMAPLYPELSDEELYQKLGMIPMQGLNDQRVDSISLEQAERLATWSKEKNLKYLSFWSINRDHSCMDEWASATCSSSKDGVPFQTESWQFSEQFLKFLDK